MDIGGRRQAPPYPETEKTATNNSSVWVKEASLSLTLKNHHQEAQSLKDGLEKSLGKKLVDHNR